MACYPRCNWVNVAEVKSRDGISIYALERCLTCGKPKPYVRPAPGVDPNWWRRPPKCPVGEEVEMANIMESPSAMTNYMIHESRS